MHPYHRSPLVDPCLGLLPDFVFRPTREVQAPKIQAADKPFLDLSAIGRVMLTGSHSWMYNVRLRIYKAYGSIPSNSIPQFVPYMYSEYPHP